MTLARSGLRMTMSTCSVVPAATFEMAQHAYHHHQRGHISLGCSSRAAGEAARTAAQG